MLGKYKRDKEERGKAEENARKIDVKNVCVY